MDVYAKSAAYADFVASGKVQIRLRNLVKTHPVPFQAKESGAPKYIVLTRVSSSDPLLDNMSKLAKALKFTVLAEWLQGNTGGSRVE